MNTLLIIAVLTFISLISFIFGLDFMRGEYSKLGTMLNPHQNIYTVARQISPTFINYLPDMQVSEYKNKLLWAGEPLGLTTETFIGIKVIFSLVGIAAGFILTILGITPFIVVILVVVLYFVPDFLLNDRVKIRQKQMSLDMPMMIGLITTAVKAGVEFTVAMEAVSKNLPGFLGDEMRKAWEEIATGKSRQKALNDLSRRTGIKSIKRFAETVVTASERGSDQLTYQLDNLSNDIRDSHQRELEEDAQKLPTKMLLPIFAFVLVPTLIMIMTPIIMQALENI